MSALYKKALVMIFLLSGPLQSQTVLLTDLYDEFTQTSEDQNSFFDFLRDNRVNLNEQDKEDLQLFPFLSEMQIDSLISVQPVKNVIQLEQIIGKWRGEQLTEFVYIKPPRKKYTATLEQRVMLPLQTPKGITEGDFAGDNYDSYNRLRGAYQQNIEWGLLTQKDIGEQSLTDHATGFVRMNIQRLNLNAILGSFVVSQGLGLMLSSPGAYRNSSDPSPFLRTQQNRAKPYLSAYENGALFGLYVQQTFSPIFESSFWYSKSIKDGNITSGATDVTSLSESGYHRTSSEQRSKNIIEEISRGVQIIGQPWPDVQLAFAFEQLNYTPELKRDTYSGAYADAFHGNRLSSLSLFGKMKRDQMTLAAELAVNDNGNKAGVGLWRIQTKSINAGFRIWYVQRAFYFPHGAFAGNVDPFEGGASGIFTGLTSRLPGNMKISVTYMSDKSLWRGYFENMPVSRQSATLTLSKKLDNWREVKFTWRHRRKGDPFTTNYLSTGHLRLQIDIKTNRGIKLRSRIEKSMSYSAQKIAGHGLSVFQEIRYPVNEKIVLSMRYSDFDVSDYDARNYEYEQDVPRTFSVYALSGRGYKWYLLARLDILNSLQIWIKYRYYRVDDVSSIGSGTMETKGDDRRDLHLSLRYTF